MWNAINQPSSTATQAIEQRVTHPSGVLVVHHVSKRRQHTRLQAVDAQAEHTRPHSCGTDEQRVSMQAAKRSIRLQSRNEGLPRQPHTKSSKLNGKNLWMPCERAGQVKRFQVRTHGGKTQTLSFMMAWYSSCMLFFWLATLASSSSQPTSNDISCCETQ